MNNLSFLILIFIGDLKIILSILTFEGNITENPEVRNAADYKNWDSIPDVEPVRTNRTSVCFLPQTYEYNIPPELISELTDICISVIEVKSSSIKLSSEIPFDQLKNFTVMQLKVQSAACDNMVNWEPIDRNLEENIYKDLMPDTLYKLTFEFHGYQKIEAEILVNTLPEIDYLYFIKISEDELIFRTSAGINRNYTIRVFMDSIEIDDFNATAIGEDEVKVTQFRTNETYPNFGNTSVTICSYYILDALVPIANSEENCISTISVPDKIRGLKVKSNSNNIIVKWQPANIFSKDDVYAIWITNITHCYNSSYFEFKEGCVKKDMENMTPINKTSYTYSNLTKGIYLIQVQHLNHNGFGKEAKTLHWHQFNDPPIEENCDILNVKTYSALINLHSFSNDFEFYLENKMQDISGSELLLKKKELCDLYPYTEYKISIKLKRNQQEIYNCIFKTMPGAPEAPTHFKVDESDFGNEETTNFTIFWTIPNTTNGIIDYFQFKTLDISIGLPCDDEQCSSLCDHEKKCYFVYEKPILKPNTQYTFLLAGVTKNLSITENPINYATFILRTKNKIPKMDLKNELIETILMNWNERPDSSINIHVNKYLLDRLSGNIRGMILIYGKKNKVALPSSGYLDSDYIKEKFINITSVSFDTYRNITATIHNLESSTEYDIKLRYWNDVGYTDSNIISVVTAAYLLMEVLYVVILIVIYIILTFIIDIYSRRFNVIPYFCLPNLLLDPKFSTNPNKKMKLKDLQAKIKEFEEMGYEKIREEFLELNMHQLKASVRRANNSPSKNRYSNILPYDHSRVKLSEVIGDPTGDYINANYVHGYKKKFMFIACQGPTVKTLLDFWRMIWEKNVSIVVNLTKCVEGGKNKCEKYWEDRGRKRRFGDLMVETLSEIVETEAGFIQRVLKVGKGNYHREVIQFHFIAWPDMNCPKSPDQLIHLVAQVKKIQLPTQIMISPIVVHCSAGVGRTGTFIAVYNLIDEMCDPKKNDEIDIFYSVVKMRYFRMQMVQREIQYAFLYQCVHKAYKLREGEEVINIGLRTLPRTKRRPIKSLIPDI